MWNVVESRQVAVGPQPHRFSIRPFDQLHGRFAPQAAIPMMCIVEVLKTFAPSLKGCIAWEALGPKELPAVRVVETLDDAVSPRLSNGNKHRGNAKEKA